MFKSPSKTIFLLLLLVVGVTISCNKEEDPISITATDFAVTIAENPTSGQVLGTLSATTNRGTLAYSLGSSEIFNGAFSVSATTGQITVANPSYFDFEARTTVSGSVIITNQNVTKTVAITVTITDVQEITVTASNFTLTTPERPALNQVLGTITASTNLGSVTYTLTSQNPAGAMAINATTGSLTVADVKKFNFELVPTVTGVVTVANGTVTATANVTITLTDVTETVQQRLDDGETPKQIYDSNNALLIDLYKKTYRGGLIATFNISNGAGLIITESLIAGGPFTYTAAVTAANNLVLNSYDDWRLPTEAEVASICSVLTNNPNFWQSLGFTQIWGTGTCCGGGGGYNYYFATNSCGSSFSPIGSSLEARAVRSY